ncbi:hypothetical protein BST37_05610 [Mycobacterium noviomagense]|uniref:Uncharacterized protein n=1 Tax=Mycobacterium noviomagense TaxID=459858 RepID=A0ABX3T8J9_9MYCO|nr:hypothetical protein BST37_05610 [Mycobacterium noviomagense]
MPFFDRTFTRYGLDGSPKQTKSEDLFSVIVKRVCAPCNNTWMNDLDSEVEPWVFDPVNDDNRCDPTEFRRWAIKVALLRSYYESPLAVEPADPAKIYAGEEIAEWHVFIGRTQRPEHRHSFCGVGPLRPDGGRLYGITQVSWTLGNSLVTALRVVTGDDELSQLLNESSHGCLKNFKQYNRWRGIEVLEVLPTAKEMPSVRSLPALPIHEVQRLVWLFTTHPISPIAKEVREAYEGMKGILEDAGFQWVDA